MKSSHALGGPLLALVMLACGPADRATTPLFDSSHTADILTEATQIDLPPSVSGNRFLKGWWPWKARRFLAMVPVGPVARIEGVNLGKRQRRLVLSARFGDQSLRRTMSVRVDGKALERIIPVGATTEIPLPADLPLGRFSVDLEVSDGLHMGFTQAAFSAALPSGVVRVEGADLWQAGYSLVDMARRVGGGERLVGSFIPPESPAPGQEFRLLLDRHDGQTIQAFRWSAADGRRASGAHRVSVPVGGAGWIRARFLAIGEGPPAVWRELALREVEPEASPVEVTLPPPPRLVIFYVMDALRADYVGHRGGPAGISPTIDRLAAEGATLVDHLSVAPNTVPSMKTLFTGQMFLLQGGWKLPQEPPTLAERYRTAGYITALLTGNGNISTWNGLSRGFDQQPKKLHFNRSKQEDGTYYNGNAERLHQATLRWLDSLDPEQRAFIHIQTIHPHSPYNPPQPFKRRYTAGIASEIDGFTTTLLDIKRQRISVSEADQDRLRGLYAASVAYNDRELDRFLAHILERYPPEEVLVVFTSDHGEELFDHGGVLHGYTLYEEQLRVPLVFWWPGSITPRRIDAPTDSLDLHRTLVELVEPQRSTGLAGSSLWPLLSGRADGEGKRLRFAAASSVDGGIFMARSDRYKLIWAPRTGNTWGQGQGLGRGRDPEALFDLLEDPGERINLAGEDILEAAWLRARLHSWIELGKRLEGGEPVEEMDEDTRRSLEALGYLN